MEKNNYNNDIDYINLKYLISSLSRSKVIIIVSTLLSSLISITYSYRVKPIWIGNFEILVKEDKSAINYNSQAPLLNNILNGPTSNTTQKFILKSPSVLMPVYQYQKATYEDKYNKNYNLSFKNWIRTKLNIEFKTDSNVLLVEYKDEDKKLIIDILTRISNRYKDYSLQNREEDLTQTINFLEKQKIIMKDKSSISFKNFNKFSIENRLGNFDGIITELESPINSININKLQNNSNANSINNGSQNSLLSTNSQSNAGERYSSQFKLLENYEALYTNLSGSLTDNSIYLNQLKDKIENLKDSLKRPTEILIKFRELKKQANRDELLLRSIEDRLEQFKLEKINKPFPWELISKPTVEDGRIFPQRKRLVGLTLLFSFTLSSLYALIRDKYSKIIYNIEEIFDKIDIVYKGNLYLNSEEINSKIINTDLEKVIDFEKKSLKIGLINFSSLDLTEFTKLLNKEKTFIYSSVNFKSVNELEKYSKILIFIENEYLNKDLLILLNQYNKIYSSKIAGWYRIN